MTNAFYKRPQDIINIKEGQSHDMVSTLTALVESGDFVAAVTMIHKLLSQEDQNRDLSEITPLSTLQETLLPILADAFEKIEDPKQVCDFICDFKFFVPATSPVSVRICELWKKRVAEISPSDQRFKMADATFKNVGARNDISDNIIPILRYFVAQVLDEIAETVFVEGNNDIALQAGFYAVDAALENFRNSQSDFARVKLDIRVALFELDTILRNFIQRLPKIAQTNHQRAILLSERLIGEDNSSRYSRLNIDSLLAQVLQRTIVYIEEMHQ